jgi:hypothetical protein
MMPGKLKLRQGQDANSITTPFVFPVSAHETDRVVSAKESFWSIVTPRSDDETEADDAR